MYNNNRPSNNNNNLKSIYKKTFSLKMDRVWKYFSSQPLLFPFI